MRQREREKERERGRERERKQERLSAQVSMCERETCMCSQTSEASFEGLSASWQVFVTFMFGVYVETCV